MDRNLLDQVPPVVGAEFGDAVRHSLDFGNEVLDLLVPRLLLVEAFLGGSQRLFRILVFP